VNQLLKIIELIH